MSTLNIHFHDKMTKFPQIFVLLIYLINFVGTQKRARISHGKRVISVRVSRFYSKYILGTQLWSTQRCVSYGTHKDACPYIIHNKKPK